MAQDGASLVTYAFQTQHGRRRKEGDTAGGPAVSKEGSHNLPECTTWHFVYILLANFSHMTIPGRTSEKCGLYSGQLHSQLWQKRKMILRTTSGLCHNICSVLYCLHIIFISIIWAGNHAVACSRTHSVRVAESEELSGILMLYPLWWIELLPMLDWSRAFCKFPLVPVVSAWEKRKEYSFPAG